MLTQRFTRTIDGQSTTFVPTGRTCYYGTGNKVQEIEVYTNHDTHQFRGSTMLVSVKATRDDVVDQFDGRSY